MLIIFRLYLLWSRFFRWVERSDIDYVFIRSQIHMVFELIKDKYKNKSDVIKFTKLFEEFYPNFKWTADTWWMLGDVIGDPYMSIYRDGDDCDGYASISLEFFKNGIMYDNKKFGHGHYVSLIFHNSKKDILKIILKTISFGLLYKDFNYIVGHTIAVYDSMDSSSEVVFTSNSNLMRTDSMEDVIKFHERIYDKKCILRIDYDKDLKKFMPYYF